MRGTAEATSLLQCQEPGCSLSFRCATRYPQFTSTTSSPSWRHDELWWQRPGIVSMGQHLCGANSQGRQACRPAGAEVDCGGIDRQSENCEYTRRLRAALPAPPS